MIPFQMYELVKSGINFLFCFSFIFYQIDIIP